MTILDHRDDRVRVWEDNAGGLILEDCVQDRYWDVTGAAEGNGILDMQAVEIDDTGIIEQWNVPHFEGRYDELHNETRLVARITIERLDHGMWPVLILSAWQMHDAATAYFGLERRE